MFCFAAADEYVFVCIYILHLSLMSFAQSNTLLVQSLHWELRLCGNRAPPQTVSVFVFSFSQALSGLSLPEL